MSDEYVDLHNDPNDDLDADDELPPGTDDDSELPADDAGGDDAGDDDGGADPAPPQPDEGRAARQIRQLRVSRQRLEDEVRTLRQQHQPREAAAPPVDPAEEDRRFLASIAELPYDQQLLAVRNRERQVVGQQLQGVQLQLARTEDRIAFADLKRENPLAAKHAAEVERQFAEYAAQGKFVERGILLKNILGEIALNGGARAIARDRRTAGANIERQRGRPSARRSDVGAGGRTDRDTPEAVEARLRAAFDAGATLADI